MLSHPRHKHPSGSYFFLQATAVCTHRRYGEETTMPKLLQAWRPRRLGDSLPAEVGIAMGEMGDESGSPEWSSSPDSEECEWRGRLPHWSRVCATKRLAAKRACLILPIYAHIKSVHPSCACREGQKKKRPQWNIKDILYPGQPGSNL